MTLRTAGIGLTLIVFAAAFIVSGTGGVLYVVLYALAAMPGLPLGLMLFGRRHPAGWVAGALLGYVLTAFAIWAVIAIALPSAIGFAIAWAVLAALTRVFWRRTAVALMPLPEWTSQASAGLAFVLFLTLALAVPPFARVGERDAAGNRSYRAYFTADFVWHTALTAELAKFSMPPRNPYLASEPIHYYWTYFLVPAAIAGTGPPGVRDVQACLKVNAVLTGLLLMSSIFMLAWAAVGRAGPVTAAVSLALIAGSFEGSYEIYRLWSRGEPFTVLRDTNIDAITDWRFGGHRIDGLPRCLWYVPQHSMAYALGLIALTGAAAAGSTAPLTAILIEGAALAGATAINPFVGGLFALAWGLAIALDALRRPAPIAVLSRHLLAAIPVGLALTWCIASRMVEGAGGVLQFGRYGPSLHAPVWNLFLSLGPVLIPLLAGCALIKRDALSRLAPALALGSIALLVMHLVRLSVDAAWVPFRAGQMFLVAAPAMIAFALTRVWSRRNLRIVAAGVFAVLLLLGLPTTAIDAYNAQDITNHNVSAGGFRWTVVLAPEQQQALAWIRRETPPGAIIQMEPIVREREDWSLIPSFAERRMAAGLPISLMAVPAYQQTSEKVRTIYASADAREASALAHDLHIDYLYVDALDRSRYPGTAKFDSSPDLFSREFRRGAAAVYKVK